MTKQSKEGMLVLVYIALLLLGLYVAFSWALSFFNTIGFVAVPHCKIVGDREYKTGRCQPYCPPHPSECD